MQDRLSLKSVKLKFQNKKSDKRGNIQKDDGREFSRIA